MAPLIRLCLAAWPPIPAIGDGQQALQPVHISDVVATVVQNLSSSQIRQTRDIVGNEATTFADWHEPWHDKPSHQTFLHLLRKCKDLCHE